MLSESQTSRIIHLLRSTQSSSPTLRISAHNSSAKTLRPAGSCCLRLGTCTQPFEVFKERRRTYALLIRPLAFNQRLNMQKLFSNDTCGSPTLLYANAVPLARSLRDRCPAIDASSSDVYTFKTEVLTANGYFHPWPFAGFRRRQRRYTSLRLRPYTQQLWKTCGTCLCSLSDPK